MTEPHVLFSAVQLASSTDRQHGCGKKKPGRPNRKAEVEVHLTAGKQGNRTKDDANLQHRSPRSYRPANFSACVTSASNSSDRPRATAPAWPRFDYDVRER